MVIPVLLAASTLLAASLASAQADEYSKLPSASILPKGTVKISSVVPGMGEHWANPKDLPLGPTYCVYKGKVICIEYMISQAGKSWPELTGLKSLPPIDHINMGFEPKGHEGYEVPHYDMHVYFVSPSLLKQIKPEQKAAKAH
ncbi:hypothetical protein [Microvirga sp.]|uniref:hypothetical protein n=1 Tax=Microvirga sp. TaxID=1873136 RepID=UPI001AEEA00A|nr:hypothetical protein [Microvirga sp.]